MPLQPEQRAWIKRCVFPNLARAHDGKVSMTLITRLFSEYGEMRELLNVMNDFVTENQAKTIQRNGDTVFVFTATAREIGTSILRDLKKLQKGSQEIKSNIEAKKRLLKVIDDVSANWQSGWEPIFKDSDSRALVTNYVFSFWSERKHELLAEMKDQTKRLTDLEDRMSILQVRIDESYNDP